MGGIEERFMYCWECDSDRVFVKEGSVWVCSFQCPEILDGTAAPGEYASMYEDEVADFQRLHRLAYSDRRGWMVLLPEGHDDCDECDDALYFTIHPDGFHCTACGAVLGNTERFFIDDMRMLWPDQA
jgi:hypothetical protein